MDIVSINSARGIVFVREGSETVPRQLTLDQAGNLSSRPIDPKPIDQAGERKTTSLAERWAETDQAFSLGFPE